MSFASAIDALIIQISSFSPHRDPQTKFKFKEDGYTSNERDFSVAPEISLVCSDFNQINPWTCVIEVDIFFPARKSHLDLLKRAVSDLEELHQRLIYSPGNEWGGSKLEVTSIGYEFKNDESGLTATLKVEIIYNI